MPAKKVIVIVLNWNGKDVLPQCLASLRTTEYPILRTVVVDNASSDGSDSAAAGTAGVDLLRLEENRGYSGGNNYGMRYAVEKYDPDYFVLLNNDATIIERGWLGHMIRVAESDTTIGMVNCRLLSPDGTPQTTGLMLMPGVYIDQVFALPFRLRNLREQSDYVHDAPTVGGPCVLLKRSLIEAVGYFDERFRPVYFEDIDYSIRASRASFRLVHDGEVSVVHLGGHSSKTMPSRRLLYIYRRNLLRYLRLYFPHRAAGMVLVMLLGSIPRAARSARLPARSPALEYLAEDLRITVKAARAALGQNTLTAG